MTVLTLGTWTGLVSPLSPGVQREGTEAFQARAEARGADAMCQWLRKRSSGPGGPDHLAVPLACHTTYAQALPGGPGSSPDPQRTCSLTGRPLGWGACSSDSRPSLLTSRVLIWCCFPEERAPGQRESSRHRGAHCQERLESALRGPRGCVRLHVGFLVSDPAGPAFQPPPPHPGDGPEWSGCRQLDPSCACIPSLEF